MLRIDQRLLLTLLMVAASLFPGSRVDAVSGRLLVLLDGVLAGPIAPTLVLSGAGEVEPIVLGALALSQGSLLYEDLEPGIYGLAIPEMGGKGDAPGGTIEVGVHEGSTSVVQLDLERLVLTADPFRPDPFGVDDSWDSFWLSALPGAGEEGAIAALTSPGQQRTQTLDRLPLAGTGFRHTVRLRGESMARSSRSALGADGAARELAARDLLSRADESYTEAGAAGGGRGRSSFEAAFSRSYPKLPLRPRLTGAIRGMNYLDGAPSVFTDGERLPRNGLDALEVRGQLHLDPGKATRITALFYGDGSQRDRFLEAFRRNAPHTPREDRASIAAGLRAVHEIGDDLSMAGTLSIQRTYLATGDGLLFDRIGAYRSIENPGPDETGLYWQGDDPSIPADQGHIYNYFRKNLQVDLAAGMEIWHRPGTANAAGAGLSLRRGSYRSYEHHNPVLGVSDVDMQSIGYSVDGGARSDETGREPGKPLTLAAFSSARRSLPAALGEAEAGLRLTLFKPGQEPLRSLRNPFGTADDPGNWKDPARYAKEKTRTSIDPRVALTRALHPRIRLWLTGGRETWIPPSEAIYYSPISLAFASIAPDPNRPPQTIYGNPALEPERAWIGLAAVGARISRAFWLRVGLEGRRIEDAITPRLIAQDAGALAFYVNDGRRDLIGLSARGIWEPVTDIRIRASYDLSRSRTETLEPELLDAGWHSENFPLEGIDPREGSAAPLLAGGDDASREFYPSLRDRRHRFSLACVARPGASVFGSDGFLSRDIEISALFRAASGGRFTWSQIYSAGLLTEEALERQPQAAVGYEPNAGRLPWTGQLDLRIAKTLRVFSIASQVWLEVTNVTDKKNTLRVFPATGEGDDDGWLESTEGRNETADRGEEWASSYRERIRESANFGEPRLWRAGLRVELR